MQWNCRSIFSAATDLFYMCNEHSPDVILLQETWLSKEKSFHLKNYRIFRLDRPSRGGGLAVFISSQIAHRVKITCRIMNLESEILALDISLPGCLPFSLVNAYFPTGVQNSTVIESVISCCRKEIILAGDFNSHHISWGFKTDMSGKRLWDLVSKNNLSCINKRTPTLVCNQSRSVLDLTFCSPSLCISTWSTLNSGTSSDHFPILFELVCPLTSVTCHSITHVNFNTFQKLLRAALSKRTDENDEKNPMNFSDIVKESLNKSKFTVKVSKRDSLNPWWNSNCSRDYRLRKAAWRKLLYNQCPRNWMDYKYAAAVFKRTVATAKEGYDSQRSEFLSKPGNRKPLFKFLRSKKVIPSPINIESVVSTPNELASFLENFAK